MSKRRRNRRRPGRDLAWQLPLVQDVTARALVEDLARHLQALGERLAAAEEATAYGAGIASSSIGQGRLTNPTAAKVGRLRLPDGRWVDPVLLDLEVVQLREARKNVLQRLRNVDLWLERRLRLAVDSTVDEPIDEDEDCA
jgi:hypothetical protein